MSSERDELLGASLVRLSWHHRLGEPGDARERLIHGVSCGNWKETVLSRGDWVSVDFQGRIGAKEAALATWSPAERLAVVASLLSMYVQLNFTGPPLEFEETELFVGGSVDVTLQQIREASLATLVIAGEPPFHLAKGASFLVLALLLLDAFSLENKTIDSAWARIGVWWSLRATLLHHRLVGEPVPMPQSIFDSTKAVVAHYSSQATECIWQPLDLAAMLELETGLAYAATNNEKESNFHFLQAVHLSNLQCKYSSLLQVFRSVLMTSLDQLTGVLGKRTKFQEKEFSQLVVLASSRERPTWSSLEPSPSKSTSDSSDRDKITEATSTVVPETLRLDSDVLLEQTAYTSTRLVKSTNNVKDRLSSVDPNSQPTLDPLDQCTLLALSLSIQNTSPQHGLTSEQISPFVTRVLENTRNWSVHSLALLLRSRLESNRTKTVERGLLQHQALVEQMDKEREAVEETVLAPAIDRVKWTWILDLPSRWDLSRELARKLRAMGVVRSAMAEFERWEMWEEVVLCWQSLDIPIKGIELIRELLSGQKQESNVSMGKIKLDTAREAKLWCLLGELESDPAHWHKALQVANNTSSRAMRSLGAWHFSQGEYEVCIAYLSDSVKLNPLFERSWFMLGCAAMKVSQWKVAEGAFSRCVAIDDENAEGWSNLASVYLQLAADVSSSNDTNALGEETTRRADQVHLHKMFAFRALKRATTISYDSWKIWTNYLLVSFAVGETNESLHALERLVNQRGLMAFSITTPESSTSVATNSAASQQKSDFDFSILAKIVTVACDPNQDSSLQRRLEEVFDRTLLDKLAHVVQVQLIYAQFCASRHDFNMAIDAHLAAYRLGPGRDGLTFDTTSSFADAVDIVQGCVDALRNWGPQLVRQEKGGKTKEMMARKDWKWQAKTLLQSFLAKTRDGWSESQSFEQLQRELESLA